MPDTKEALLPPPTPLEGNNPCYQRNTPSLLLFSYFKHLNLAFGSLSGLIRLTVEESYVSCWSSPVYPPGTVLNPALEISSEK